MSVKPEESEAKPAQSIEDSVAKAEKAFALRKFEEAVDHYATALELS